MNNYNKINTVRKLSIAPTRFNVLTAHISSSDVTLTRTTSCTSNSKRKTLLLWALVLHFTQVNLRVMTNLISLHYIFNVNNTCRTHAVADSGFPVGGVDLVGGVCGLPRRLHFENFLCRNERIWTLRGGLPSARPQIRQ